MEQKQQDSQKETLHGLCSALEDLVSELEGQIGLTSPDTRSQSSGEKKAAQTSLGQNLTLIRVRLDDLLKRLNSLLGLVESCQKLLG